MNPGSRSIRGLVWTLLSAFPASVPWVLPALDAAAVESQAERRDIGETPDGASRALAAAAPESRIEARSADLLAVGIVAGNKMSIHLSRLLDNAPVHDAVVSVALRGSAHPTVAEADGSYTLITPDLEIPGPATVLFQVDRGVTREAINGTLALAGGAPPSGDRNSARQLWWWVLNFAVCIGFLKLWSARRKNTSED